MDRCYCKIIKKLNKLEKELQHNSQDDTTLAQEVQEIRLDLNINTQSDLELSNRVDNIEIGSQTSNLNTISELDLLNLFNNGG